MIVDGDTLDLASSIEGLLEALADVPKEGEIKSELMESVCEIATDPCRDTREAGSQLRALRRLAQQAAAERGLAIGSSGTHPFAMWEDQRVVSQPRYHDLIADLQFVARQEIIFGIHVHVGLDDADKAIHVANGMRVHVPLLLALSANSPFWRGQLTGLESTRTPIFRAFPRVGIPPRYENFATVEIRAMDSQTRVEHTLGIAALIQAMVKELAEHFEAGKELSRYPYEMLDENKWIAARHGLEGDLVDLPKRDRVPVGELARRVMDRVRPHAEQLGSVEDFDALEDILDHGTGAARQHKVYDANHDLREVVREVVDATSPEPAEAPSE